MIADADGWVLWPPIRFSYNTQNKNPPMAFPVKPTWMLTDEDCKLAVERGFHPCNAELEWNWLGTDDQGRDVIARVHLRLPPFGAVRPGADAVLLGDRGGAPARCRAISAAGPISCSSASSRSGPACRSSIC